MKTLTVWHFAADKLRDGSPLPKKGDILPHIADPELCERGWHGSIRLIDALRYAPGCNLAKRELRGEILTQRDKACASDALQVADYVDVRPALVRFAQRAALHALRVDATNALERAGLSDHAATLRALPDDCDLRAARAAVDAACAAYAARAAVDAAYAAYAADAAYAAYAAVDAAYAAARAADATADAAYAAARAAVDAAYAAYAARERLNTWLTEEVERCFPKI